MNKPINKKEKTMKMHRVNNSDNNDNDDITVGRILTRREALALLSAGSLGMAAMLVGCGDSLTTATLPPASATTQAATTQAATTQAAQNTTQAATVTATAAQITTQAAQSTTQAASAASTVTQVSCVVRPEMTEGPYFVDEKINRSDIRSDPTNGTVKEGVPLILNLVVAQAGSNGCLPLKNAQVDIWHCDALGVYSDVTDRSFSTKGQKFLRGYQQTDANGQVQFTTIYPGWYSGRAVHIHFKIRTTGTNGQPYEFTSQFFMDETITDQVHAQAPYTSKKGKRDTLNSTDSIYRNGGSQLTLSLAKSGNGYAATFGIGLDLSDTKTGAADGFSSGR